MPSQRWPEGETEAPGCRRELAEPWNQSVTELFLGSWSGRGMEIKRDKQVCICVQGFWSFLWSPIPL